MTDVDHRLALREAFKGLVGAGGGVLHKRTGWPVPESFQRQPVSAVPWAEHYSHRAGLSSPSLGESNEKRLG